MGTTGSSVKGYVNSELPDILARIRKHTTVPLAVGFGVATRTHFDAVAEAGADGVVVGSRLVSLMKTAENPIKAVEDFCRELKGPSSSSSTASVQSTQYHYPVVAGISRLTGTTLLPPRFGQFGGQYVPEALFDCLIELEEAHNAAREDPAFWAEFESHYGYMNRPSKLYFAESLTKHANGAKIWLKREDLYVSIGCRIRLNSSGPGITPDRTRSTMQSVRCVNMPCEPTSMLRDAPDPPSEAAWEDPHHRRNWCRPAWRSDRDRLCTFRAGVCHLHGRGGCSPPGVERVPHKDARGHGGDNLYHPGLIR